MQGGRIFLCHLIDLNMTVQHPHNHLPITLEAKWPCLEAKFPSKLVRDLNTYWISSSDMQLFTDASGSKGWGAFWNGRWLQSKWTLAHSAMPIVWKELYAIVCAVHTWGHLWTKQKNSILLWQHIGGWHLAKGLYMWYRDHMIGMHAILSCCTLPHYARFSQTILQKEIINT